MKFEIEVEVRPDFPLPAYKALTVKRPSKTINEADVDVALKTFLERYAQLVPKLEGGAEVGDFVTADLKFHKDGAELNEAKEVQFRLQPELRFQDGHIADLEAVLKGVKPGETKEADGPDRLELARPEAPRPVDRGDDRRARPQDAADARGRRRLPPRHRLRRRRGPPRGAPRRARAPARVPEAPGVRSGRSSTSSSTRPRSTCRPTSSPARSRPRSAAGYHELKRERPGRRRHPRPRGRDPGQRPRVDPPEPQGVLPPGEDRRGGGDQGRGRGHGVRDQAMPPRTDEIAAADPGPGREGGPRRRPGLADPRAEDDRPDPRLRQVRGHRRCEDEASVETIDETVGVASEEEPAPSEEGTGTGEE